MGAGISLICGLWKPRASVTGFISAAFREEFCPAGLGCVVFGKVPALTWRSQTTEEWGSAFSAEASGPVLLQYWKPGQGLLGSLRMVMPLKSCVDSYIVTYNDNVISATMNPANDQVLARLPGLPGTLTHGS